MSSTTSKTKATALAQVQALIAGTAKHFPNGQFTLLGTVYTTATLTQVLTNLANVIAAVVTAHAGVKDALTALAQADAQLGPIVRAYKRYVLAAFAHATQELQDFGLQPPKQRKPRTSEQNAAAAAKAKATRAARGTKGAKEKRAIKGDVTSVSITPVTSFAPAAGPAVSTPVVQTAPNASSAQPPADHAGTSAPK